LYPFQFHETPKGDDGAAQVASLLSLARAAGAPLGVLPREKPDGALAQRWHDAAAAAADAGDASPLLQCDVSAALSCVMARATVWVKRFTTSKKGPQFAYTAVKGVDLAATVDDFKAFWVAQTKQRDVDPALLTLRRVACCAHKPSSAQEAAAEELDDPSLSLAEAQVTHNVWLLACVAGAPACPGELRYRVCCLPGCA
jgi:hypothetical protein